MDVVSIQNRNISQFRPCVLDTAICQGKIERGETSAVSSRPNASSCSLTIQPPPSARDQRGKSNVGVRYVDKQANGQDFVRDRMDKIEKAFREKLLVLKARGATNDEVSAEVMRSPFILALVWAVTSAGYLRKLRGWRGDCPPARWEELMAQKDLRDEWRCETVYLLGMKCKREGILGCDFEKPRIGGFWRSVVSDKAIKAAWKLYRENTNQLRRGETPEEGVYVHPFGDDLPNLPEKKSDESRRDLSLDVQMAVNALKDTRQQAVVRLVLLGHSYREVAAILSAETNEPVTYDMVRFAFEKAKELLGQQDIGLAA